MRVQQKLEVSGERPTSLLRLAINDAQQCPHSNFQRDGFYLGRVDNSAMFKESELAVLDKVEIARMLQQLVFDHVV
jgi:hypothetical protein